MKKIILLLLVITSLSFTLSAQTITPFKDGDRAVFLGNSITDGGHYHSYIWLYYMTRFPHMNLKVYNAGIGGNTAEDMYNRLDTDVFNKHPTVLMVTFGMNDSGYFEYNGDNPQAFGETKYQECFKNYQMMEKRLQQLPGTRIVMMGSSPYDETAKIPNNNPFKGKNAVMKRIVQFQKQSAAENNWQFTDLNEPMTAINRHFQQMEPAFTICGNDRIHPDNDGHMVMAYLFLKEQGFAGKEVANIEINASNTKVIKSANCEISNIKKNGKDLSFDYLANSLPYPMDTIPRGWEQHKSQAQAVKIVPFIEEMNQEILKVTGLKGEYKLFIDNEEIGVWNADDLAKGINLATETKTPQYQQALAIMYLNEYRWEIERGFRQFAWIQFNFFRKNGLLFANNRESINILDENLSKDPWLPSHREIYTKLMLPEVYEAREQEMNLLVNKIYEINKPVKRTLTLKKI